MNCDIIKDLLPLYIDGVSSESTNKLIEEHLSECEDCQKELELMQDAPIISVKDEDLEKSVKIVGKKLKKFKKKTVIKAVSAALALCIVLTIVFQFVLSYQQMKRSFEDNNLIALGKNYGEESVIGKQPEITPVPNVSTICGDVYINPSHGEYVLQNNRTTDEYSGNAIVSASIKFSEEKYITIMDNSERKAAGLDAFTSKKEMLDTGMSFWTSLSLVKMGFNAIGIDTTYAPYEDLRNAIKIIEQGQFGYNEGKNSFAKTYATYWAYEWFILSADEYFLYENDVFEGYGAITYLKDKTKYAIYLQDKKDITKEYSFFFIGFTEEEVKEIYVSFTVNK